MLEHTFKIKYATLSTGIEETEKSEIQMTKSEISNYPNPVHSVVSIQYSVVKPGQISLKVYDICGKLVRTLVNESKPAGTYTMKWDGRDNRGKKVASGIYLYRIEKFPVIFFINSQFFSCKFI